MICMIKLFINRNEVSKKFNRYFIDDSVHKCYNANIDDFVYICIIGEL